MDDPLAALRFAHVALAVLAMGTNLTFPFWVRAAEMEPEHLAFALETDPACGRARGHARVLDTVIIAAVLAILALMVAKPF